MRGYTTLRKDEQYWVLVQILIVEIAGRWESGHSLRRPEPRPRLPALPAMSSLSDFELSFLDLFRQFDAADRDSRRIESLEPQHRQNPLLYTTMILLHPNSPMRNCIPVESNHPRPSVVSHCSAEEAFRGGHITSFAQQEVHCSPVFVDGSVEVGPVTLHLYIGFRI